MLDRNSMTSDGEELTSLYQALVEQAFDGLVIIQAGIIVYANPAFAAMMGYALEDVIGKPAMEMVAPEARAQVAEHLASGTEARYESLAVRRDRCTLPVEIVSRMCVYRGAPARLTAIRDVADAHRSLGELRASELRFRQLIEALPEMVLVHRRGQFVYGNPHLLEYMGFPDQASLQQHSVASLIHPDDVEKVRVRMAQVSSGERGTLETFRHLHADGRVGLVELVSAPVDWNGEPATLTLGRDVSQTKEMEQRLVEAELLATVGRLAAAVNHEMNNPLTYLSMTSDVLTHDLAEVGAALAKGDLQGARASLARLGEGAAELGEGIRRVVEIAGDFKTLTSVRTARPEPVDVAKVVASAARVAAAEIRQHARLAIEIAAVPQVRAHAGRLGQVVLNLLVNAAHASAANDSGHVVRVRTSTEDAHVLIDVDDSGTGVPPELRQRVFEAFFSTKPSSRGSGLGLSISRGLVESFGGTLEVARSELGGARFRIRLPAA
jgi:two-component system NtrC family sensor kinase